MNRNGAQLYKGTAAADDALLFTTSSVEHFSHFTLMSSTGAVDVEVSVDGTNWSTAALALEDQGATANSTYVLVTVALRPFKFYGKYTLIRVRQNGVTASAASLLCGIY